MVVTMGLHFIACFLMGKGREKHGGRGMEAVGTVVFSESLLSLQ
jgi:hypothetical protein